MNLNCLREHIDLQSTFQYEQVLLSQKYIALSVHVATWHHYVTKVASINTLGGDSPSAS